MVDLGNLNNNLTTVAAQRKEITMATHVLQVMFQGHGGFKWPVAYYGSTTALSSQIHNIVWKTIDWLDDIDFEVDYVMLDGASTNRSFINMNPSTSLPVKATQAPHDPAKIVVFVQDIKHCIKKIRNGVFSSRITNANSKGRHLLLENKPIVWDFWEGAYLLNQSLGIRAHRKLTREHIDLTNTSKMRNHLAADVLDGEMLHLMKLYKTEQQDNTSLDGAISFLEQTAVLVDIFNDRTKPVTSLSDERLQKLKTVQNFFASWEQERQGDEKKSLLTKETREDIDLAIGGF